MRYQKQISKTFIAGFLLFSIFQSCKKDSVFTQTENQEVQKANSLTKMFTPTVSLPSLSELENNRSFSSESTVSHTCSTLSYSIISGCSSNTLIINSVEFSIIGFGIFTPEQAYIKIRGYTFPLTFVSSMLNKIVYYKSANIPLSLIGINDFCSATTISVDYYYAGAFVKSETLLVNEGVSCGSGSYQSVASSPAAGKLSFYIPLIDCACSNLYPPSYIFEYRLQGTTSWTTKPVAYPDFLKATTITGLPAGVYEVYGQNTCANNPSPAFVPSISTPITVH